MLFFDLYIDSCLNEDIVGSMTGEMGWRKGSMVASSCPSC